MFTINSFCILGLGAEADIFFRAARKNPKIAVRGNWTPLSQPR